jgi:hypothetical protein
MWELRRLTTLWAFPACYRDSFTLYVNMNVGRFGDLCCPGPVRVISYHWLQRHNVCGVGRESTGNGQQFYHSHDSTPRSDTVWSWQGHHLRGNHDGIGHGRIGVTGELSQYADFYNIVRFQWNPVPTEVQYNECIIYWILIMHVYNQHLV